MRILAIVVSISILIGFDQSSKWIFENLYFWNICSELNYIRDIFSLCHADRYVPILWDYIWFQLSYNTGVAFSLPIRGIVLQLLTVFLIAWIIYQYIHEEYNKRSRIIDAGYVLILAGAISHAYERIFIGHVVDFIAVKYFAILNFADILISIGAMALVFYYIYYGKQQAR